MRILFALLVVSALVLSGCSDPRPAPPADGPRDAEDGRGDVTVVAILDGGFDPYHWDFLAQHMPQHQNDDPADDLPLDQDPATWIPGHPGAAAFASHEALRLNLTPDDERAVPQDLHDADQAAWDTVARSIPFGDIHMKWIPGTKVVGFVDFAGNGGFATESHGVGTTSVSVGNLHGTCPSCVFVFVNGYSDAAVSWVATQPWIDAQSNSWGYSTVATEKMYVDCDLPTQRAGVERGQQIFFSGGNGMANAFDAPVPTLYSCQKAPDWVVTVGANTPGGNTYTGAGKPVDLANVGSSYPSQGGSTVTGDSTFSGTSNATPVTMGLYAQALYELRRKLDGPSRLQDNGTIAQGHFLCADAEPSCALQDGVLTVHELRNALFDAAQFLALGVATASESASVPVTSTEWALMGEGHGSYTGHLGDVAAQVAAIVDLVTGEAVPATAPDLGMDIEAFAIAVSYCTQQVWGTWEFGAWAEGVALPAPDPAWPLRTWFVTACPQILDTAMTAVEALPV